MTIDDTLQFAQTTLDDLKAEDMRVLDVHDLTTIADRMVIASGRSDRHVKSLGETLTQNAKGEGLHPGVEGLEQAEWVLIDLGGVLVHIMQPDTRAYYQLEKLWDIDAQASESGS